MNVYSKLDFQEPKGNLFSVRTLFGEPLLVVNIIVFNLTQQAYLCTADYIKSQHFTALSLQT